LRRNGNKNKYSKKEKKLSLSKKKRRNESTAKIPLQTQWMNFSRKISKRTSQFLEKPERCELQGSKTKMKTRLSSTSKKSKEKKNRGLRRKHSRRRNLKTKRI
jgi:hypothetical protein